MAETKKATTKKTTTSTTKPTKPKETTVDVESMAVQMQQMMALMAQQQQMIAQLSQQEVTVEEPKQAKRVKKSKQESRLTKQYLRREYKDTEIYLQNVTHGIVSYKGRNGVDYVWSRYGDIQAIKIDDNVTMNDAFLKTPWLVLDEFENDEIVKEEIIEVLKLDDIYEHLFILTELEEDVNNVDLDKLQRLVNVSKNNLILDVCSCVQQKIKSGELESYKRIEQFEKIVGRKFEK